MTETAVAPRGRRSVSREKTDREMIKILRENIEGVERMLHPEHTALEGENMILTREHNGKTLIYGNWPPLGTVRPGGLGWISDATVPDDLGGLMCFSPSSARENLKRLRAGTPGVTFRCTTKQKFLEVRLAQMKTILFRIEARQVRRRTTKKVEA